MQARIRTPRCYEGPSGIKRAALASIFVVLTSALTSCSFFVPKVKLEIEKSLNGLCLTSTGKGRLEHPKGRHVFNYEALWEKPQKKWSMAFELPIIGQELLALSVRQKKPLRLKTSGTFARRLQNDVSGADERALLNEFYEALGHFLLLMESPAHYDSAKGWKLVSKKGELHATYSLKSGGSFYLKAYNFDEYYRRMRFVLRGKKEISLDFFVFQCSL